ncbi:MAG: putative tail appendage [Podoviridae sp. ctbj_2]|nr:MAG: putative tail appendage [Podoviridae sp. ctbj_2]
MDMDITGRRFRRLGMDKEAGGVLVPSIMRWTDLDALEYNTYLWEQVSGEPGLDFMCVQVGNQLMFFKPGEEIVSVNGVVGSLQIPTFTLNRRFYMAGLDGYLVVVCGSDFIAIIDYNKDTGSFTLDVDRLKVRDLFGVEETQFTPYETDPSRRGPLTSEHYYNLYNQGWGIPRWDWKRWNNDLYDPVWLASNKGASSYPSNADVVWSGVDFRGIGEDDDEQPNNVEAFNYLQFIGVTGADITAARGYFIIDALRRGQSRTEQWINNKAKYPQLGNLVGVDFSTRIDQTTGGPSCVAAHAGRIFYSGFSGYVYDGDARSPNYNNYLFFSQLVKNKADFAKCYQEGDPTSRETHDVVDTDGGFLKISQANKILSLFTMGSKLIVIADNGVWAVAGGSDYGFSATNYRVDKLSTFGGLSASSVVVAGDAAYFWAAEGIYAIAINEMGDLSVSNITNEIIKTFYSEIPTRAKRQAYGVYDIYSKRVRWMYRDNEFFSQTITTRELVLDTQIQCFFPFEVKTLTGNPYFLLGGVKTPPFNIRRFNDDVYADNEPVVTSTGEQIIALQELTTPSNAAVKYVGVSQVGNNIGIFFSRYTDEEFRDWKSIDGTGVDANAYLETGSITTGDVAINKQIPYLTMIFENTEKTISNDDITTESSCIGRVQWDFGNGSQSNKWSRDMQLYRKSRFYFSETDVGSIDDGFSKTISKTKLRGRGRAFSLRFETEEWKDLQIRGWVLTVTSNGVT